MVYGFHENLSRRFLELLSILSISLENILSAKIFLDENLEIGIWIDVKWLFWFSSRLFQINDVLKNNLHCWNNVETTDTLLNIITKIARDTIFLAVNQMKLRKFYKLEIRMKSI